MKWFEVQAAIDAALIEIIKLEIHNVFGAVGVQTDQEQRSRLATGFERVIEFERMALALAAEKFQ